MPPRKRKARAEADALAPALKCGRPGRVAGEEFVARRRVGDLPPIPPTYRGVPFVMANGYGLSPAWHAHTAAWRPRMLCGPNADQLGEGAIAGILSQVVVVAPGAAPPPAPPVTRALREACDRALHACTRRGQRTDFTATGPTSLHAFATALWKEQNGLCWHTGVPMVLATGDFCSVTVDRADSRIAGLRRGNTVLTAAFINPAPLHMRTVTTPEQEQWREVCRNSQPHLAPRLTIARSAASLTMRGGQSW